MNKDKALVKVVGKAERALGKATRHFHEQALVSCPDEAIQDFREKVEVILQHLETNIQIINDELPS